MRVKLKILATNIRKMNYTTFEKCPITEALHEAGLAMHDAGLNIENDGYSFSCTPVGYYKMRNKLFGMYDSIEPDNVNRKRITPKPIPIKDFEVTLTFTKEQARKIQYLNKQ